MLALVGANLGENIAHCSGCIELTASFDTRRRFAPALLRMRWVVDGIKRSWRLRS
jgi:ribosomal protein L28